MKPASFGQPAPQVARSLSLGLAAFAAFATGAFDTSVSGDGWSVGPAAAHARNGGDDRGSDDHGGRGRGGSDDDGGDDHDGGRGRKGDDGRGAGGNDDDDDGRGRGRGRGGVDDDDDDDRGRGRGRGRVEDARPSPTGPIGAPGGAVSKVERSASGFEIEYTNGWKVEVEDGRFEVKNPAGRTVEERPATPDDFARFRGV